MVTNSWGRRCPKVNSTALSSGPSVMLRLVWAVTAACSMAACRVPASRPDRSHRRKTVAVSAGATSCVQDPSTRAKRIRSASWWATTASRAASSAPASTSAASSTTIDWLK